MEQEDKQYAFLSRSGKEGSEFLSVIKAPSLLQAITKYIERYRGEHELYYVKCFELIFTENGVADFYFADED